MRRLLVLLLLTITPGWAAAHPLAPALLELIEHHDQTISVRWKTSLWRPTGSAVEPALPAACTQSSARAEHRDATGRIEQWTMQCPAGLVDSRIGVSGLDATKTTALVRVTLNDGHVHHAVLSGEQPDTRVLLRPATTALAWSYTALGIDHILSGIDHLLFVFGLVLLVANGRALIATVSAFTLGHSVTLGLAALGYVAFPAALMELLIALTLLYLAVELADERGRTSWLARRPWRMAAGFGLLHGFGFAGALHEIGLPESDIPLALLAFNAGIEIGQLAFVAVVLVAAATLRIVAGPLAAVLRQVPVYAMGTLAVYWCCERSAALWP